MKSKRESIVKKVDFDVPPDEGKSPLKDEGRPIPNLSNQLAISKTSVFLKTGTDLSVPDEKPSFSGTRASDFALAPLEEGRLAVIHR